MDRVRSGVHFTDLRTVLSQRGEQGNLETHYNSCDGPPLELHDAISDCTAICGVLSGKSVTYDELRSRAVSLESVLQKRNKSSHPLLIGKLVTPKVAEKIGFITRVNYLKFSEEELIRFLKTKGVTKKSITLCVKKWRDVLGK